MKIILFFQLVLYLILEGVTGTVQSFGNLIYDVTEPLKNNHLTVRNETRQSDLERDIHVSAYAYSKLSPNYADSPVNIRKYVPAGLLSQTAEIGLIFPRHHVSNNAQHTYGIVIRMNEHRLAVTCKSYCSHLQSHFPKPSDRINHTEGVKLGLEVTRDSMKCITDFCQLIVSNFDILVYNVEVYSLEKLLLYGPFEENVERIYKANLEFARDFNSKLQFYARISMAGYSWPIFHSEPDLYRAAIANNVESLISKGDGVHMITDIYSESTQTILKERERSMRIIPTTTIYPAHNLINDALCDIQKITDVVSTSISKIILQVNVSPFDTEKPTACNAKKHTSAMEMNRTNLEAILLAFYTKQDIFMNVIETIEKQTTFELKRVYSEGTPYAAPRNMSVGCIVRAFSETFKDTSISHCGSNIFLEWIDNFRVDDHEDLTCLLEKFLSVRDKVRLTHANATMFLKLPVLGHSLESPMLSKLNIYCAPHLNHMKTLDEVVMKWSAIHNVDVILHSLIDTNTESGWWFQVGTDKELNRTELDFVLLVRRNSNKIGNMNFVLPFTYPCIEWTVPLSNLNYAPINFDNNKFSGIAVNLNIPRKSPLTPIEIQTMLSIAYGRFSSVEVTGSVEQISKALAPNLRDAVPSNVTLLVEFVDVKLLQELQMFNSTAFPVAGVHISNWESQTSETRNILNGQLEIIYKMSGDSFHFSFGVTVQNCISEINSNFTGLKALEYFKFIRYIVCVVKPVHPSNVDKRGMQTYLDTIFYIQQYVTISLGIDTYFRLSFLPQNPSGKEAGTGKYLRFLRDLSQHAEAYKIKYFFGDAFASSESMSWSWWRITDYSDLSNASAYIELESEYFGRPTEQKYKVMPDVDDETKLVFLLSTLSLFLLVAICGLWTYHRLGRKHLLTVITSWPSLLMH